MRPVFRYHEQKSKVILVQQPLNAKTEDQSGDSLLATEPSKFANKITYASTCETLFHSRVEQPAPATDALTRICGIGCRNAVAYAAVLVIGVIVH